MAKWYRGGTGFAIDGDNLAMRGSASAWKTTYGSQEIKSGKCVWKIKIIKKSADMMIGVASNTKYLENSYWSKSDTECYAYYSGNGHAYGKSGNKAYSEKWAAGSVMGVHLDLDNQCIWFSKDGKNLGNAYTDVARGNSYRLTVGMYGKDDEMKFLSYNNTSDDEKKQEKDSNCIEKSTAFIMKQTKYLENELSNNKIQQLDVNGLSVTAKKFGKINDDINKLEIELAKCKSQLSQKGSILKQKMTVNISSYKQWSMDDVQLYICGLENGRYSKYITKLLEKFANDGIKASNLPELDQGDLRQFGIENFGDRKGLRNQFQKLTQGNEGGNTH
eukprot:CAMPEP_0201576494 /NCGR_PEP_ID=MMETSP0190_2-20130828/22344_1 /ASSEMBLY_ACC=CAM_ASM_000263 /TAXON_ID=37353 /ORGANISM="Rosalina sp." /LENGTH=331 /DNA_ID=CAMNT_0048007403 /DNA_START=28 /DNA_END=1023 /DNA_ORIENTATION=-